MVIRGPLTNSEGFTSNFKAIKETQSDSLGKPKHDIADRAKLRLAALKQTKNVLFIEEARGHTMK